MIRMFKFFFCFFFFLRHPSFLRAPVLTSQCFEKLVNSRTPMHHRVLLISERAFVRSGYHVLRYNSRGVGNSSGWPSFTGLTEGQDLQDIINWTLEKLKNIGSIVIMVRISYIKLGTPHSALRV